MASATEQMRELFLDTAYAIALSSTTDNYHDSAVQLANQLRGSAVRFVTTHAVLLEIGNGLSKVSYRQSAVRLLNSLLADPQVEMLPFSAELYNRALELYSRRPDKEWGLTDCVSFVVMQDRAITEALTTDAHFQQAGFRALLREYRK